MNHKILEQIEGGAFLAGDLPMSTSSLKLKVNLLVQEHSKNTLFKDQNARARQRFQRR